jgi:hypothetical protein
MVKLGTLKSAVNKLNFRTWISKYGRDGNYTVRLLFPPKDFPSFSIIFEDEVDGKRLDVKLTIRQDKFKEAMKALGITLKKADLPTLKLVVKDGDYGLAIGEDVDYVLAWQGSYWFRVAVNQKEDFEDF